MAQLALTSDARRSSPHWPKLVSAVTCAACGATELSLANVNRFTKQQFWDEQREGVKASKHSMRGMNIPIRVCSTTEMPQFGETERYGHDLAVASFWWAVYLATQDADAAVLEKFVALALDVPFDFRFLEC